MPLSLLVLIRACSGFLPFAVLVLKQNNVLRDFTVADSLSLGAQFAGKCIYGYSIAHQAPDLWKITLDMWNVAAVVVSSPARYKLKQYSVVCFSRRLAPGYLHVTTFTRSYTVFRYVGRSVYRGAGSFC